eukprot:Awhi_evm1s2057
MQYLKLLLVLCLALTSYAMVAPKTVYSAWVHNNSEEEMEVKVYYGLSPDMDPAVIRSQTIRAGSQAHFGEEEQDMDGWMASLEIIRVTAESHGMSNSMAFKSAPFEVSSPTRDYRFDLGVSDAGQLQLAHHP